MYHFKLLKLFSHIEMFAHIQIILFLWSQKLKYKKKIRQMNSQLSEAKHESSLNVFEMKDELQKLRQENSKLNSKFFIIPLLTFIVSLLPDLP